MPSLSNRSSLTQAKIAVGFTLVEMAVVVLIAAILLTAGLSMVKSRLESAQLEVTQKKQDAIKQALISYLGRNKRLPCPDNNLDGREDRDPAAPYNCGLPGVPQNFGGVPYVDLGLDRSAALDGWENYIRYVVSPNWRFTYSSPVTSTTNITVPTNVFDANAAFVPKVSRGTVAVYTNTTIVPALDPCVNSTGAVVGLVSHGRNGFYATNVAGNANAGPAGPNDETQNATPTSDPPGVPAYGCTWNVFRIVKHDPTDTYDDVVLTISEAELTAPLIASGALQGSPEAAITKANEIVLGTIAGNRAACPGASNPVCASGGYYYVLPATFTAFPPEILTFGVTYTNSSGFDSIDSALPASGATAYTLQTPSGVTRTVTFGELRGILVRVAGFL